MWAARAVDLAEVASWSLTSSSVCLELGDTCSTPLRRPRSGCHCHSSRLCSHRGCSAPQKCPCRLTDGALGMPMSSAVATAGRVMLMEWSQRSCTPNHNGRVSAGEAALELVAALVVGTAKAAETLGAVGRAEADWAWGVAARSSWDPPRTGRREARDSTGGSRRSRRDSSRR